MSVDRMLTGLTSEGTKCEPLSFGYNPRGCDNYFSRRYREGEHSDSSPYCQGECQGIQDFSRDILGSKIGTFTTSVDNGFITTESPSDLKKLELHIVTSTCKVSKAAIRIVNGNFEEVI